MRRRCRQKTSPAGGTTTIAERLAGCSGPSPLSQAFASVPADPRLQFDGAIFDACGMLKDGAYKDLRQHFCGELPSDQHPHPYCPGLGADESIPPGLKTWDDDRVGADRNVGAGWIAAHVSCLEGKSRPEERWFNVRTWGSWRLAFLLARLQREVWERRSSPMAALSSTDGGDDDGKIINGVRMSRGAILLAAAETARQIRERNGQGSVDSLYGSLFDVFSEGSAANTVIDGSPPDILASAKRARGQVEKEAASGHQPNKRREAEHGKD